MFQMHYFHQGLTFRLITACQKQRLHFAFRIFVPQSLQIISWNSKDILSVRQFDPIRSEIAKNWPSEKCVWYKALQTNTNNVLSSIELRIQVLTELLVELLFVNHFIYVKLLWNTCQISITKMYFEWKP